MCSIKDFGKILIKVDKSKTNLDFWEKQKESFQEIEKVSLKLEKDLTMSSEKYHTHFNI